MYVYMHRYVFFSCVYVTVAILQIGFDIAEEKEEESNQFH